MLENRFLRRVFGPKRDEVTGEWRNLHNEELNNMYYSPNIVRVIENNGLGGTCSTHKGEERHIQDFGGGT